MLRMIETRDELRALPGGSVLDYGLTKMHPGEPAGLEWCAPGDPMGYAAGEIKVPIALLKEGDK